MSKYSKNSRLSAMIMLSLTALIQGCGSKVDCNDSQAKADAIEIIQTNLAKNVWYNEMSAALSADPKLSSIKTMSHSDELNQGTCRGNYNVTYNNKPREFEFNYSLAYLQDKGKTEVRVAVNDVAGGLMALVMTERPIKNGVEKIMDPTTGNIRQKIEWKNGAMDGWHEIFNPRTNQLQAKIKYANGQKSGSQKIWDDSGEKLLMDVNWNNGKATGFEKKLNPTNGKLLVDLTWEDGKETGFLTTGDERYYEEQYFKAGLRDGVQKVYAHIGYLTSEGMYLAQLEHFKDGKLHGLSQRFGKDGKVMEEKNFKDGVDVALDLKSQENSSNGAASSRLTSSTNDGKVAALEFCLDSKINAYRKEVGQESIIRFDQLEEWKAQCAAR